MSHGIHSEISYFDRDMLRHILRLRISAAAHIKPVSPAYTVACLQYSDYFGTFLGTEVPRKSVASHHFQGSQN